MHLRIVKPTVLLFICTECKKINVSSSAKTKLGKIKSNNALHYIKVALAIGVLTSNRFGIQGNVNDTLNRTLHLNAPHSKDELANTPAQNPLVKKRPM